MNSDKLDLNIQDLQRDVINLLRQASSLLGRAIEVCSSDSLSQKYAKFQQEVIIATRKVEELELKMAIVAPMKAGKSTIINAIVGQELLPSRNEAMTTLPTELVFKANLEEPVLILSEQTQLVLQETIAALKERIKVLGTERVQEKIAQYPHLIPLLEKIQATDNFSVPTSVAGREELNKTLIDLNDIIRLHSRINQPKDVLSEIKEVPRIETPFWKSSKEHHSKLLGNLVIVDTPGPNEAGENLNLAAVVEEQLRQSSIVLIVIDFTSLNSKAAVEVKEQVQPIVELLGQENLYVLVNKIDQRREDKSMTPEEVRRFIAADLGLGDSSDVERVFEVSARRAFAAANFMQEIEQYSEVVFTEMKSARSLAEEVFSPTDWEEDLETATLVQLKNKAEKLWEKNSGFTPFLEKAISALIAQAAPRCVQSALKISRNRVVELRDDLKLLLSAIDEDEAKIRAELSDLEADIGELETRRSLWETDVDKILEDLKCDLDSFPKKMMGDFKSPSFKKELEEYLSRNQVEYQKRFEIQEDAEKAFMQFAEFIREFMKDSIDNKIQQLDDIVKLHNDKLSGVMNGHPKTIIESAKKRLEDDFNVSLTLELPEFMPDVNISNNIEAKSIFKAKKLSFFDKTHNFLMQELRRFAPKLEDLVIKEYYSIALDPYIEDTIELFRGEAEEMRSECVVMQNELPLKVEEHIKSIEGYLNNYRNNLRQSITIKTLLTGEYQALNQELNSLLLKSENLVEPTDKLLSFTNQLLVRKSS